MRIVCDVCPPVLYVRRRVLLILVVDVIVAVVWVMDVAMRRTDRHAHLDRRRIVMLRLGLGLGRRRARDRPRTRAPRTAHEPDDEVDPAMRAVHEVLQRAEQARDEEHGEHRGGQDGVRERDEDADEHARGEEHGERGQAAGEAEEVGAVHVFWATLWVEWAGKPGGDEVGRGEGEKADLELGDARAGCGL